MRTATRLGLASLALILVSSSACSGEDGTSAPGPAASATGAVTPTSSPTAPGSPSTAGTRVIDPSETVFFESPSGNVACSLGGPNAVCEIQEHTFEQPERPSDCDLDYGTMIGVEGQAPASFICHGDTAFGAGSSTLDYGQRISNGLVSCTSRESGVACATADGTHGFELSRAAYRLY